MSRYIPDRKVLAGGLTGLVVWAVSLACQDAGYDVPADVLGLAIALVAPTIAYLVPPSVKDIAKRLDGDIRAAYELQHAGAALDAIRTALPLDGVPAVRQGKPAA